MRKRAIFEKSNLDLCSTDFCSPPATHDKDKYVSVMDAMSDLPELKLVKELKILIILLM
jgi:hypothetical protein